MQKQSFQITVASIMGVVACFAINFWLFRQGVFWGIVGLNVTKHVMIAYLCKVLGVDRRAPAPGERAAAIRAPHVPVS
jgi:hypothetical protein